MSTPGPSPALHRLHIPQPDSSTASPTKHRSTPLRQLPMLEPTTISPIDLQSHLYVSLLEGRTADVALRVRGSWEAVYNLHRVVIIQAGFFRSLFTSGFVESAPKSSHRSRFPNVIDVVFDDRNITRAAFEICIARLYGGGPPLHVSPSLVATPAKPLTPAFPSGVTQLDTPPGHQTATPRFLLSLLATAVYLSIPSTASQSLNLILGSIGPYSAVQYLNFAVGKGIESSDDLDSAAAVGLEGLAQDVNALSTRFSSRAPSLKHEKEEAQDQEVLSQSLGDLNIQKENPAECLSEWDDMDSQETLEPKYHYGAVSDKIGEASVCWLARWGPDILAYEQKSSESPFLASPSGGIPIPTFGEKHIIPVIWRRGGLNPKWVRALVSSDAMFVKGERERYEFAKSIVELRRKDGIREDEEKEWTIMFSEGIYYAHMSLDDIITLSRDTSIATGKTYVSLAVLQAAHWTQSLLRHQITSKPPSNSSPSPPGSPTPSRDKELGIGLTTVDIYGPLANAGDQLLTGSDEQDKVYYPIPPDSSLRLGDLGGIEGTSMDQLFEISSHSMDPKTGSRLAASESNYFGLLAERRTGPSCIASDPSGKSKWSRYPPFRFAVEFWDVDSLKEKSRLHSHTVWYAGSLFNVYVQVVRKKGVQLGVYLHRQSCIDPVPPSSTPSGPPTRANRTHSRGPSLPTHIAASTSVPTIHQSPSFHPPSRSTTPLSSSIPSSSSMTAGSALLTTVPATITTVSPLQPYRDPRASISAHFTISCASATGASLTRFTSAPDVFSISQSWGWKSSSLRTEEYLEVGPEGQLPMRPTAPTGKEVSLRATVVLGIV